MHSTSTFVAVLICKLNAFTSTTSPPPKQIAMSTEDDLVTAIKESLENDGTLGRLKAEMRTKVIKILNGESHFHPPEQPKDILLINELVREYLSWSGYKYAKSVFIQECRLNSEPLPRSQLLEELGWRDTEESSKLSVLQGIVSTFKEMKNELG